MAQVAKVRTRKRGKTFSYIFEAGKVDGKRKVVEKGGFTTQAAAYKAGIEAYNNFLHGNIGITSESITLAKFMTSWLENVVALNVKPTSLRNYNSYLKNQIQPRIGDIKIQEITPAILDKWLRDLQKTGLSYNLLLGVHTLIHSALNYAVYPAQLIISNPVDFIKVPKNAPRNIVKRHIITPEKLKSLFEKYPFGTELYIPLLLLYYTGMRLGEVLGLTWEDINFTEKKINLTRQLVYLSKKGYYFSSLKTKSSNRYILISDFLSAELQRWRQQQLENEKQFGDHYIYIYREADNHIQRKSKIFAASGEKINLVCTYPNGRLLLRDRVTGKLRSEGINSHSFRHSHATQLIEHGAVAKAVAYRLGHSNTQITQNLYTHNTLKLQEDALAIFDQSLQTKP